MQRSDRGTPAPPGGRAGLRKGADTILLLGGAVAAVASFLPYVAATYNGVAGGVLLGGVYGNGYTASSNAWHSYAVLGLLLLFAATALHALRLFSSVELPAVSLSWGLVTTVAAAAGTALITLRALTWTGQGIYIAYGGWILIAAGVVVSLAAWSQIRRPTAAATTTPGYAAPAPAPMAYQPTSYPTPDPHATQDLYPAPDPQPAATSMPWPTTVAAPPPPGTAAPDPVAAGLARLAELHRDAVISDAEHEQLRTRLLNQLLIDQPPEAR
jgi:hypothetical protein